MDVHVKKNLIYEPRAFWDQVSARTIERTTPATLNFARATQGDGRTFALPRANFTNGSRYPIDLTKMSICPLGYFLSRWEGGINTAAPSFVEVLNDMSWLSRTQVRVSAPKRANLQGPLTFCPGTVPADPTSDGGMGPLTTQPFASNLLGLARWDFDRPFKLVRNGVIRLDMTPVRRPRFNANPNFNLPLPDVAAAFFEHDIGGSRLGGSSRNKTLAQSVDALTPMVFPQGPCATTADYWDQLQPNGPGSANPWPAQMSFDASSPTGTRYRFRAQETDRGATASNISGFAVMLRQIYWDEFSEVNDIPAGSANSVKAPVSTRVGTRCKTKDGGTNEWWWRPGAPLCLVAPTITPSVVVTLPKTITLGPGESLEVEVVLPPDVPFPVSSPPVADIQPMYNLGVSFTGYATVEG